MPTGSTTPGTTIWATAWALVSTRAPQAIAVGTKSRWSSPTRMRATWGPTRPTKPMIPTELTVSAAIREAPSRVHMRTLSTFTPMARARASPSESAVSFHWFIENSGVTTMRETSTMAMENQVARSSDPMVQNTIRWRDSWEARY